MKLRSVMVVAIAAVLVAVFLASCGRKEKKADFVGVGADTISVDSLATFAPGGFPDGKVRPEVVLQVLLAARAPVLPDDVLFRTAGELRSALSLRTGTEWSMMAVTSVYQAARALWASIETGGDSSSVRARIDSLAVSPPLSFPSSEMFADRTADGRAALLTELLVSTLVLPREVAQLVAEFAMSPPSQADTTAVEEVIKGLVYDSATEARRKAKAEASASKDPARADNSALALKFRGPQSIKDSIGRHIPNLEALYKKQLKVNANMEGMIVVTFRVDAGGKVMSARVKSAEIGDNGFVTPLLDYAHRIRFKSIPDNVGPMTFDFPFEFRPRD